MKKINKLLLPTLLLTALLSGCASMRLADIDRECGKYTSPLNQASKETSSCLIQNAEKYDDGISGASDIATAAVSACSFKLDSYSMDNFMQAACSNGAKERNYNVYKQMLSNFDYFYGESR